MALINRYRVLWAGGAGGAGISTFYSLDTSTAALAAVRSFFASNAALWPSTMSFQFPNSGDTLESTTGQIAGGWTAGTVSGVTGSTAPGPLAAGVGARVVWGTGFIVNGRRLKGSTFITDILASNFQSDGTIANAIVSQLQTFADTLVGTNQLIVWSRPRGGLSAIAPVTSANVPDRVTALRSRRY